MATKATIKQAEAHGYRAAELGFALSDNPHTRGTEECRAWDAGYSYAQDQAWKAESEYEGACDTQAAKREGR